MLAMPGPTSTRGSIRTCVGCQKEAAPDDLVRFVRGPDGSLAPVLVGSGSGRAAWVHPAPECLTTAAHKGLSRSFRAAVEVDPRVLAELIRAAANRRVVGLLMAGSGSRSLAIGAGAVAEALAGGRARLVIVASDARTAAESHEVREAIAAGRARGWGTKNELGRATHRSETGIVAVLDSGLARALAKAIDWAHTPEPQTGRRAGADLSTEE
jgi:predicted RNA-binding protein YlxR (DUF448 family)